MVVLRVEGSIIVSKEGPLQIQGGGNDAVIIFGSNRSGVFGGGIQYTDMKINRNFYTFTDFKSLELEVPTFCLVTGCVSARRDRR
jgi:hypothetical protein